MMSRATEPIRIIGGRVIDPTAGGPVVRDVYVADGRVCSAAGAGDGVTIDATGCVVMAGAIDMHTHVASRGVAMARARDRALVPCPAEAADAYCRMGYTTVVDAAVPLDEVDQAHDALDAMSNVDTGFLLSVGSHRPLIEALDAGGTEAAIGVLEDLLDFSGALGIKLVNPGLTDSLDTAIAHTRVTPRMLIQACAEAVDRLELAHALHVHVPQLGLPGNVETTLDLLEGLGRRRIHLAHVQFSAYEKNAKGRYASGVARLVEYVHGHENVTLDTGNVAFGPAMMISGDQRLASRLAQVMGEAAMELDGWSVMPMRYEPGNAVNVLQWAMGMELCLAGADTGRVALSMDHPNGGSFTKLLDVVRWLGDANERERMLRQAGVSDERRETLGQIGGQTLDENALVMLTRVAPAKALGRADKGHLRPGAIADVVIADSVGAMPRKVIKCGRVVVEDGDVVADTAGKRLTGMGV